MLGIFACVVECAKLQNARDGLAVTHAAYVPKNSTRCACNRSACMHAAFQLAREDKRARTPRVHTCFSLSHSFAALLARAYIHGHILLDPHIYGVNGYPEHASCMLLRLYVVNGYISPGLKFLSPTSIRPQFVADYGRTHIHSDALVPQPANVSINRRN